MTKNAKKNFKQCTLDGWQQKKPMQQTETVHMAKCGQKQQANDALKQIFGHGAYKSDVQQRAVSAILTGLQLLVESLLPSLNRQFNASCGPVPFAVTD